MLLICMCLLQAICSASTVSIVDYTGNTVSVEAPVHRVVSLGTGVAEYIYALDGGQCLVGRDSYSHFPPEIQNVPVAGKSSYSPDLETIMKLQPDLVIADSMISDEDKKEMEDAGIPVIIDSISDPSRDVGVMENLERCWENPIGRRS
jgi:iron complex transport system substrate-binding protein